MKAFKKRELESQFVAEMTAAQRRKLTKSFKLFSFLLIVVAMVTLSPDSFEGFLGAIVIAFAALLPSYLWCSGRGRGFPIFPVFAFTYLWTYMLPLAGKHPEISKYSPDAQLVVGLTVAGFLGLSTIVWLRLVKSVPEAPISYRVLEAGRADFILLLALAANDVFTMGVMGGWFTLDAGLFGLIRGVLLGMNPLAVFALAYRWGRRDLTGKRVLAFVFLLILYTMATGSSLLLVGSLSTVILASVGFALGRQRVPWLGMALILIPLIILHYGKGPMRDRYFATSDQQVRLQPWEYPSFFVEWVDNSLTYLLRPDSDTRNGGQSFAERAGLVHLLLMAQDRAGQDVGYLSGSTYAVIPELLVPRILAPDKPSSHEGTTLLNVYYGRQTREQTTRTTIGWGLLNEAYANFGFLGCAGLAIVLGAIYGYAARLSIRTPILSARALFTVLLTSIAFQTEFSASVYVTVLFQATVPLVAMTFLLMKTHHNKEVGASSDKDAIHTSPPRPVGARSDYRNA